MDDGAKKPEQLEKIRFPISYASVRCEMTLPSAATVTPGSDRFFSVLDPASWSVANDFYFLSGCVGTSSEKNL